MAKPPRTFEQLVEAAGPLPTTVMAGAGHVHGGPPMTLAEVAAAEAPAPGTVPGAREVIHESMREAARLGSASTWTCAHQPFMCACARTWKHAARCPNCDKDAEPWDANACKLLQAAIEAHTRDLAAEIARLKAERPGEGLAEDEKLSDELMRLEGFGSARVRRILRLVERHLGERR